MMPISPFKQLRGLALALLASTAGICHGATQPSVKQMNYTVSERRGSLDLTPYYFRMSANSVTISGFGMGAGFNYATSKKWSVGAGVRKAFSRADGYASIFTTLDISVMYAITGSLVESDQTTSLDGKRILDARAFNDGGWRVGLTTTQYYFNANQSTVPYSGFSAQGEYEFSSQSPWSYAPGVRVDRVTNDKTVLLPLQLYLRCSYGL